MSFWYCVSVPVWENFIAEWDFLCLDIPITESVWWFGFLNSSGEAIFWLADENAFAWWNACFHLVVWDSYSIYVNNPALTSFNWSYFSLGGWSIDCWSWDLQWSALYINNIQHLWKPNIFITIPEEINWDYTSEWDDFDLIVSGYNVDAEYIEWVINKQNYIPTTEDLTEVFSNLGSFGGLLVVCLFVILVFYMFKKIFS